MDDIRRDQIIDAVADFTTNKLSECCGANLYENMICSACKEHSGIARDQSEMGSNVVMGSKVEENTK
jgi:hypothetical protein